MRNQSIVPDLMPHLSAGRHRTPRRGACFMEFASFLAGERWSDHPNCTDRVLASLARAVNDLIADDRRDELVTLIPRVIGLKGHGSRLGLVIALRAATAALPVASFERQRALAVGAIATLSLLEDRGAALPGLREDTLAALEEVPDAARWAHEHLAAWQVRPADLVRNGCEAIVRTAALGIAQACILDPDDRLVALLVMAIEDAEALVESESHSGQRAAREAALV